MQVKNFPLGPLTSFGVGGPAELFVHLKSEEQVSQLLTSNLPKPWWILGSGTNCLISDRGLAGTVLRLETNQIKIAEDLIVAQGGAIWDDLVLKTIEAKLWGFELMSGIPGTVGAATWINISAYGQALSDRLVWVDFYDQQSQRLERYQYSPKDWDYKKSPFQGKKVVILRVALRGLNQPDQNLVYQTALDYGNKHKLNPNNLEQRRQIIMGVRQEAGSLLNETPSGRAKTCGSFFKNPLVSKDQAKAVAQYDETGLTTNQILATSRLHGRDSGRASAAHILLAAGFCRGQKFDRVRLHPDHVLKLENYRQASAQEIYDTARLIQAEVNKKLGIKLKAEVSILGNFNQKYGELV